MTPLATSDPAVGATAYPDKIVLSDTAGRYLDRLADDLLLGNVELWQLPPSLFSLYCYGHEDGRRSRQPEVDQLNGECDRLYLRAYNSPAEVTKIMRARVDQGLAEYEAEFMANGGDVK